MSTFLPKLKLWQVCKAKTHFEFLNKTFGTDFIFYRKNYWWYNQKIMVWFPRIDGKIKDNFKNTFLDKSTILQTYCGETELFDGRPLTLDPSGTFRLIFEVVDNPNRKYIFQGVYVLDRDISTPKEMVFKKVSDIFPMD